MFLGAYHLQPDNKKQPDLASIFKSNVKFNFIRSEPNTFERCPFFKIFFSLLKYWADWFDRVNGKNPLSLEATGQTDARTQLVCDHDVIMILIGLGVRSSGEI